VGPLNGVRLGRVRLQVADLDRSLRFYRDVIGFRVLDRDDDGARLGSWPGAAPDAGAGAGADHGPMLLELVERPGARPVPRTGLLGIYHFALLLPTRPDLGRFVRHHAREGTPMGAADHAFSEALYLEDPDGITIEVYRDRPREEWPAGSGGPAGGAAGDAADGPAAGPGQGGGLPLVSDPLDAAGLMAAAGDTEWDGVPAGAVVGHMHFFVDDLEAARAFYVDGLGFDPMIAVPTALFVSAGGYHHHVGLNTWRAGARTATDEDAKLLDWELVVPDDAFDGAVARLEEAGHEVERVGDTGEGRSTSTPGPSGSRTVMARDPWGIAVRLTSP
jgi:catechol 2,3-dioxygenase